ncbi:unnamed protein product (macronuclear) [Paramecium tetraurelia]|uniref:Uncharacterized protein n=1 Tax=Paramecium tetraurelia TaxID=5888 RepID=A0DX37_PARTE|nr:uncharacterized protein GSPATT00021236001 [Paramecium tetraurelia]CAK87604.1 unnamed protein product [Paramecium tetraurelia]|eukprot:XP_001455001.1 hypothetical protein (macronuclear) [Paramecium tetraurelia strain d4-2]
MKHLNNNQTLHLTCDHIIDYNNQDIGGFNVNNSLHSQISNDSNYIAIFTNSQQDIETFQFRIYCLQSFKLIITFNVSKINIKPNSIYFSDNSSYFYYNSYGNHLTLLNLQDLTFKTIPIHIQSMNCELWLFDQTLLIKDNLHLHIYNVQNEQKIEQLRLGFTFSQFTPFSRNNYYLLNDKQSTLELWSNYHSFLKMKLSKQFSKLPGRIMLLKDQFILCVINFRIIKLLSKSNFQILRSIILGSHFNKEQLHFDDEIAFVKMQMYPSTLNISNLMPEISHKQLKLENGFLEEFTSYEQTSKLLIGIKLKNLCGFELKIYKLPF